MTTHTVDSLLTIVRPFLGPTGSVYKELKTALTEVLDALAEAKQLHGFVEAALKLRMSERDTLQSKCEDYERGFLKIRVAMGLDLHSTDHLVEYAEKLRDKIAAMESQNAELEETCLHLNHALRDATEAPTFMGEPVSIVDLAVSRFLCWKLPKDFYPDSFISFEREKHDTWGGYPNSWPTGTNLFNADQARAMFRHCLSAGGAIEQTPKPQPLSDERIEFGLNCNMEDPSDEEADGFYKGVRFAEHAHGLAPGAAQKEHKPTWPDPSSEWPFEITKAAPKGSEG